MMANYGVDAVSPVATAGYSNAIGVSMTTDAERANENLVNRFCQDWAKQDAELLTSYFAEPFEYMVW